MQTRPCYTVRHFTIAYNNLVKFAQKRDVFVAKYINSGNAAAAARKAGYAPGGARQEAQRLLKHPEVQQALSDAGCMPKNAGLAPRDR